MPTKRKKSSLVYFGGYITRLSERHLRTICRHRFPNYTDNWKSHIEKQMAEEYIMKYLIEAEAALANVKLLKKEQVPAT